MLTCKTLTLHIKIILLRYILGINFNFPTWKRKTIPFYPHKHMLRGQNRIVFHFQVGKLKFIACNLMGNFEWNKVKNQDKKDNLKKSFQPSNRQ